MIGDSQETFDLFQSRAKCTPQIKGDTSLKFGPSLDQLEEGIDAWVILDAGRQSKEIF